VVAVGHAPKPSQLTAALTVPPEQLAAPHDVVFGAKTHEVLVPSHRLPQVPAAQAARPLRGVWFAASVVHFPIDPARSHAWQDPPHARSQQ
jgi:hypothetical protein